MGRHREQYCKWREILPEITKMSTSEQLIVSGRRGPQLGELKFEATRSQVAPVVRNATLIQSLLHLI